MNTGDIRVLTTDQLIRAIRRGNSLNLNRQLNENAIKKDAHKVGFHVFEVILAFHEAFDKSLPAHHRVMGLIRLADSNDGAQVIFDVPAIDWNSFMTPESFADRTNNMLLHPDNVVDINA